MVVGPRKMILLSSIFADFGGVGTSCNKEVHLLEDSVVNMISLLFPFSDLRVITNGPGGLLLVVSHLFLQSQF
jgi:hypothetical protein